MDIKSLTFSPPVIAHRGACAAAPENTLVAFRNAHALGFRWVEFDVMLSKDQEVVVFHDTDLLRITGNQGSVADYSYAELAAMDAGSWFSPKFAGEKIPRFQEVLLLLGQLGVSANIEIKATEIDTTLTVKKTLDILKKYGTHLPHLFISSFSMAILQEVRKDSAAWPLGLLIDEWHEDWQAHAEKLDYALIDVNQAILSPEIVAAIKATHRKVLAYTVNVAERAQELMTWGVDAIFSDCTPSIVSWVKSSAKMGR